MAEIKNMSQPFTLRMLGENITLRRHQWEELAALLKGETVWDRDDRENLANRIAALLDTAL